MFSLVADMLGAENQWVHIFFQTNLWTTKKVQVRPDFSPLFKKVRTRETFKRNPLSKRGDSMANAKQALRSLRPYS